MLTTQTLLLLETGSSKEVETMYLRHAMLIAPVSGSANAVVELAEGGAPIEVAQ